MIAFNAAAPVDTNSVFRWLHAFFGILWIGLLYYLNFVQVPTMPKIPAEQKGAITGHIAPKVFFFFRYGALLTLITGLVVAAVSGYGHTALTFTGEGTVNMIGLGMWLAIIMAFNVWFIIWPAQQKILGLVEATAEAKAAAAPRAQGKQSWTAVDDHCWCCRSRQIIVADVYCPLLQNTVRIKSS
jgi:uncharacterized membrane protein